MTSRKPKILEVTLSSDEEDDEEKPPPSSNGDSDGPVTKEFDDTHEANLATFHHPPPVTSYLEDGGSSDLPSGSGPAGLNGKRSHSIDSIGALAKEKRCKPGARPKGNQRARTANVSSSPGKKMSQTEMTLAAEIEHVNRLGKEEVDLNDEKNSAFLESRWRSQKIRNVFNLMCQKDNLSTKVGRPIETQIRLSNGLSKFPEIEKAVEEFVNARLIRKKGEAPDFVHIQKVVQQSVQIGDYPTLQPQDVNLLAQKLFKDAVSKIRKRRVMDSWKNGYSQDVSAVFLNANPSDLPDSPELTAKLEANDRLRRSVEAQMEYFGKRQEALEQSNPNALKDDCDSDRSDDSSEED